MLTLILDKFIFSPSSRSEHTQKCFLVSKTNILLLNFMIFFCYKTQMFIDIFDQTPLTSTHTPAAADMMMKSHTLLMYIFYRIQSEKGNRLNLSTFSSRFESCLEE